MKRILFLLPLLISLFISSTHAQAQESCPIFNAVSPANPTDIDTISLSFNNNGQGSYSVRIDDDNNKIFKIFPPYSSTTIGTYGVGNHSFQVFVDVLGGTPPSCPKLSFNVAKAPAGATPVTPTPTVAACASRCDGSSNCTFCPGGGVLCGNTDVKNCSTYVTPTPTQIDPKSCPICPKDWFWSNTYQACQSMKDTSVYANPGYLDCSSVGVCVAGCGCDQSCTTKTDSNKPGREVCPGGVCITAIGSIGTNPTSFIKSILGSLLGVSGGLALILIIISGYRLMASQGNPEQVQGAREMLTSAVVGLLFIIFSFVILQVIGVDILKIPGFGG